MLWQLLWHQRVSTSVGTLSCSLMSTSCIANFAISEKKFSVWESEKLFAHQFFRLCIHTHKGVKIDLIAGVLLLNANKKQQQQQREKQKKTKKKTNSHYPREKTYQAFIHSCCQLIDLKRTLLLNAIKKNLIIIILIPTRKLFTVFQNIRWPFCLSKICVHPIAIAVYSSTFSLL